MLKKFLSEEDMLRYESEREQYYLNIIKTIDKNFLNCYKTLLLEAFHPYYRRLKKEYDSYKGGWWRDEHGFACAHHIRNIDCGALIDCDIVIERNGEAVLGCYLYTGGCFVQIQLKAYEINS